MSDNHSSTLTFCPECSTLMDFTEEKVLCSLCNYSTPMTTRKLKATIYKSGLQTTHSPSVVYDNALKRTTKVPCSNPSCDTHRVVAWGTRTKDGFLIGPDMVMMNYQDPNDRINTYVCCVCKSVTLPRAS